MRAVILALVLACLGCSSTWRQADIDATFLCQLKKATGQETPALVCRSFDSPHPTP